MNQGQSNSKYGGAHKNPKKVRFFGGGEKSKKTKNIKNSASSNASNKIWMAALAGASAGVIAGLLMAPESGKNTLDGLRRKALSLGDELDQTFRAITSKMEDMGVSRAGDSLRVQGNWDMVKGKLKAQYGDLTDQDLAYVEGKEDVFLGNLENKLGKSKKELIGFINSLV